jgi:hypothetical protein
MADPRLVLHIGLPKTGSSLIQRTMKALRPRLRERGVAYVARSRIIAMKTYAREAGKANAPASAAFLDELRTVVAEEAEHVAGPVRTVIVSNEATCGWPTGSPPYWPNAAARVEAFVSALAPASMQVLAYVRRQDRFLESMYMQQIHGGATTPWEEYRDEHCADVRIRYTDVFDAIATVEGVTDLTVKPFEIIGAGGPAFVADFLETIGLGDLGDDLPAEALILANASFSEPAWRSALTINRYLTNPADRRKVRKFLGSMFPPDRHPKAHLLTDRERAALIERYRDENERLFRTWMPSYPTGAYSTPDGTAALASVLPPRQVSAPETAPPRRRRSIVAGVRWRARRLWRRIRRR